MRFVPSVPPFLLSLMILMMPTTMFLCAGCGGRSGRSENTSSGVSSGPAPAGTKDTGPVGGDLAARPDLALAGKDAGPEAPLGCTGDCHDYVISALRLPLTTTDVQKIGFKHKGKTYNGVGSLISLLAIQLMPNVKIQPLMEGICSGDALNLLRVKATSLAQASQVSLQSWTAQQVACCKGPACYDDSAEQCKAAPTAACFSGKGKFLAHAEKVARVHRGTITAGQLVAEGELMTVRMLFEGSTAPLVLELRQPQIRGTVSGTAIEGSVAGLLDQAHVEKAILPWLTKVTADLLSHPLIDGKTRKQILQLFDTDNDGKVTITEIANNPLIRTFLKGESDVDWDNDGVPEVSVGVGMSAVKAVIGAP